MVFARIRCVTRPGAEAAKSLVHQFRPGIPRVGEILLRPPGVEKMRVAEIYIIGPIPGEQDGAKGFDGAGYGKNAESGLATEGFTEGVKKNVQFQLVVAGDGDQLMGNVQDSGSDAGAFAFILDIAW